MACSNVASYLQNVVQVCIQSVADNSDLCVCSRGTFMFWFCFVRESWEHSLEAARGDRGSCTERGFCLRTQIDRSLDKWQDWSWRETHLCPSHQSTGWVVEPLCGCLEIQQLEAEAVLFQWVLFFLSCRSCSRKELWLYFLKYLWHCSWCQACKDTQ